MARNNLRLPTKSVLTAKRKGRMVAFRYVETFATPAIVAATKRLLAVMPPDVLRGLRIVSTRTTVGIVGTVSVARFGQLMVNEFSCWGNQERMDEVKAEAQSALLRKMKEVAASSPGFCSGHTVAKGVPGVAASESIAHDGVALPLCGECAAIVRKHMVPGPSVAP